MENNKSKAQNFRDAFSVFVNKDVPDDVLYKYMEYLVNKNDSSYKSELIKWVCDHIRKSIIGLVNGIDILEGIEILAQPHLVLEKEKARLKN